MNRLIRFFQSQCGIGRVGLGKGAFGEMAKVQNSIFSVLGDQEGFPRREASKLRAGGGAGALRPFVMAAQFCPLFFAFPVLPSGDLVTEHLALVLYLGLTHNPLRKLHARTAPDPCHTASQCIRGGAGKVSPLGIS